MNQISIESNESFAAINTGSSSKAGFRKKQAFSTPNMQLTFPSSKLAHTGPLVSR